MKDLNHLWLDVGLDGVVIFLINNIQSSGSYRFNLNKEKSIRLIIYIIIFISDFFVL